MTHRRTDIKTDAALPHLPDEVWLQIMGRLAADDFPAMRLVSRQWSRLASDDLLQRDAYMPKVVAPLSSIIQKRGGTPLPAAAAAQKIAAHAPVLFARGAPKGGTRPRSWLQLAQQAEHMARQTHLQARLSAVCRIMAHGIWSVLVGMAAFGLAVSSAMHDQGITNDCPALVALGATCGLVTFAFVAACPVLWFVYNAMGLVLEETQAWHKARLACKLQGRCWGVGALLQELA